MTEMLGRNPINDKTLQALSDLPSSLLNFRRIPSYPFPKAPPFIQFPFGRLPAPALGTCFRVWGSVCSGSGRNRYDFGTVRAASDGSSGGGDGFRGWGDGGSDGGGGGGEDAGGNDWSLLSWYLTALDKHPVATKSITSAFLTLIGDLICQLLINHVPKLDEKRTFVFAFLGLVLVGPALHFWYLSLSKLVSLTGVSGATLRLFLDQFLFSPIFIGIFLCALVTLEGKPSQVVPKLQQEWFPSVLANWQLWIPFQFLNFQFVPQKFQVLAANIVALAWNVILSFKAHKEIVVKQEWLKEEDFLCQATK